VSRNNARNAHVLVQRLTQAVGAATSNSKTTLPKTAMRKLNMLEHIKYDKLNDHLIINDGSHSFVWSVRDVISFEIRRYKKLQQSK
jgi:hypothetical protein